MSRFIWTSIVGVNCQNTRTDLVCASVCVYACLQVYGCNWKFDKFKHVEVQLQTNFRGRQFTHTYTHTHAELPANCQLVFAVITSPQIWHTIGSDLIHSNNFIELHGWKLVSNENHKCEISKDEKWCGEGRETIDNGAADKLLTDLIELNGSMLSERVFVQKMPEASRINCWADVWSMLWSWAWLGAAGKRLCLSWEGSL